MRTLSAILSFSLLVACSSKHNTNTEPVNSKTAYTKDEITVKAEDGLDISAYYYYNEPAKDSLQPLVVLIHQFKSTKDQWDKDFIESLLKNKYKVLAYDIRGHGKSTKVSYELTNLLTDPNEAPSDVRAVLKWSKKQKGIDSMRIAAVGTSIGGNLACYGRFIGGVKVAAAISNSKEGFHKFNGIDERMMSRLIMRISNVLLICGSSDGQHEQDQKDIYENYLSDPREKKVYDSDKHGIYLLREHPEIYTLILNWLNKYL